MNKWKLNPPNIFQKSRMGTSLYLSLPPTSIDLLFHLYHLLLPIASHSPFSFSTQPSATIVTSTVIYQLRSTLIVSISSPKETEQCFHNKLGHLDLTILISFFRSNWCTLLSISGASVWIFDQTADILFKIYN